MNTAVRCMRALGVFVGGLGIFLFALQALRSDPAISQPRASPAAKAPKGVPEAIPEPTTPAMAALRAKGLARIEEIAATGSIEREDTEELKRIHRGLDTGGKMALAAAFGDEFVSDGIHIEDPRQLPF